MIFDMSRRITRWEDQSFLDFEHGLVAHPSPRQQQGWFAIVFANPQLNAQHYIWFVRLPLDEQGKLVLAARDQFLQLIVERLASTMDDDSADKSLPENPFQFTPGQQQLADFNSISRKALHLPPSAHFQVVNDTFEQRNWQQWEQLALQGISDWVVFTEPAKRDALLGEVLTQLPDTLQAHILQSLENQVIGEPLSSSVANWIRLQQEPRKIATGLRALCGVSDTPSVEALLDELLHAPQGKEVDVLVVIAGRLWPALTDKATLSQYLANVAHASSDFELFRGLFSDLVQIPLLRDQILQVLRDPHKDEILNAAIGAVFSVRH